jgi:hypothetical protein
MTWDRHHSRSELLAIEAEAAMRAGDRERAEDFYRQAAVAEGLALEDLPDEKKRTRGVTAVSSVALWYKGRDYSAAEMQAHKQLATATLPSFAQQQLKELLHLIWATQSAEAAGVRFVPGDVLVSLKGGQVIHGGAPLDLIVRKVEGIQAVLFRTVEMLLEKAFRRHGQASAEVQEMFRPWLFQAPAGSYQFAVRVQEPEQKQLWEPDRPKVERVTATFFRVLRASATDPEHELLKLVPDPQYRAAFLNLSRNLAPTGKAFERLEVRDAGAPSDPVALFVASTRKQLNTALRSARPQRAVSPTAEPVEIRGILRAVHLDEDWLEVATLADPSTHIRVDEAGDALDDVVGPMVNRLIVLQAVRQGPKYFYRDIELDE